MEVKVNVKSCKTCPFVDRRSGEYVSPDSFEGPNEDWYCKKNGKKIRGYIEWYEENKIQIPDWCVFKDPK